MNKKRLIVLTIVIIMLFIAATGVYAANVIYINSNEDVYVGLLSELFATGSDGLAQLGSEDIYAMTARGLEKVEFSHLDDNKLPTGGGEGLLYTNGKVQLKSNVVKVGLYYYYSSNRDTGLAEVKLENAVGTGFSFGYFDDDRNFVEQISTAEKKLTLKITSGSGIGIYSTASGELLYEQVYTDADIMLGVMPISDGEDAVTLTSGLKYYGGFEFAVLGGDKITVINVLDIEKYVMGVCASEMSESWPREALKAQAVAARTYVQKSIMNTTYYTRYGFDVTNDTYCQAYSGCSYVGERIMQAVEATENRYITYNDTFIEAMYFSSDGGATEDNENVNGNNAYPYLQGVYDPYEEMTDSFNSMSSWQVVFTPAELAELLDMNGEVTKVTTTLSEMGNVIKLVATSSSGQTASLLRGSCRTALGLYSIRYTVSTNGNGHFVFDGSGWGHHLGMSQFGAYAMASYYDKTYKDILGFYYTGVGLSYGVK